MSTSDGPLEDAGLRARLDSDNVLSLIELLPDQCRQAWRAGRAAILPDSYKDIEKLVVAGMGGSAIAGDFLVALAFDQSRVPVCVVRGYDLPGWVDARTLVIASSHSGTTEETLSAFRHARSAGAKVAVITTGGRLGEIARQDGLPVLTYTFAGGPRYALGHSFMRLLAVATDLGLLDLDDASVEAAMKAMESLRSRIDVGVATGDNLAKQMALRLNDRLPLIVGGGFLAPVARRWATQINENADMLATWEELPELDHNFVVGLRHPADLWRRVRAVFLDHNELMAGVRHRYAPTIELFERAGASIDYYEVPEPGKLAAMLCALYLGDYVSYYLAMLNGEQPSEIDNINYLKQRLAELSPE